MCGISGICMGHYDRDDEDGSCDAAQDLHESLYYLQHRRFPPSQPTGLPHGHETDMSGRNRWSGRGRNRRLFRRRKDILVQGQRNGLESVQRRQESRRSPWLDGNLSPEIPHGGKLEQSGSAAIVSFHEYERGQAISNFMRLQLRQL